MLELDEIITPTTKEIDTNQIIPSKNNNRKVQENNIEKIKEIEQPIEEDEKKQIQPILKQNEFNIKQQPIALPIKKGGGLFDDDELNEDYFQNKKRDREFENDPLQQRKRTKDDYENRLLGQSQVMLDLKETIRKLARSQAPVYISGESGTGKEVVARLIHDLSPRAEKPFIPVNCGAIPSELMESEFFGHKKGSFTGATEDKIGLFQAANEGTLFLDEVADLPISMQVKLLRAIQEKTIRPIGHAKEIPVNIRLLSATHKDLAAEVAANRFRQDLFYRINVIQARIPALKERGDDIILLANIKVDKYI